jgi:hypothetical protein
MLTFPLFHRPQLAVKLRTQCPNHWVCATGTGMGVDETRSLVLKRNKRFVFFAAKKR